MWMGGDGQPQHFWGFRGVSWSKQARGCDGQGFTLLLERSARGRVHACSILWAQVKPRGLGAG